MPENMQNQTPCSSEVKLQKQVWAGGRASLGPRAASERGLGVPESSPEALEKGSGQDRAEGEERREEEAVH